jgi:phosphate transport system protein
MTHLQQELENLRIMMFRMADLSIEAIGKSVESLKRSDKSIAESIIDSDSIIDKLEIDIDDECIRIIATRQPAAVDLRLVLSILKINTDLERIGDLATVIAMESLRLNDGSQMKPITDMVSMSELAIKMLRACLISFSEKNISMAMHVIDMDNDIDKLNMKVHKEIFSIIEEHPRTASGSMGLLSVSKALERIGDHATNIAEKIIYYIGGEDVRHRI